MQGKEMFDRSAEAPVYVGIDVCKDWLDIHLHPVGRALRVANNPTGLKTLTQMLRPYPVALVVMEATGKHHRRAQRTLHATGLAVAVINPLRARLFAEASGALAKTDAIDARLLAILGEGLTPRATPPAPQALEALQELVRARAAARAEASAVINRRHASQTPFLRAELARRIKNLERHIARLEGEIASRVKADPGLMRRYAILLSIPGVGPVTATTLLVDLSELGHCSGKAASLLAGLAPIARDSGQKAGVRRIRNGRAGPRKALYMAALSAARNDPDLSVFYKRLRDAGKKPKIALTAVMRKIVVLANTLLTEDRLWQPKRP